MRLPETAFFNRSGADLKCQEIGRVQLDEAMTVIRSAPFMTFMPHAQPLGHVATSE
jgi:hypothetical protein